MNGPNPAASSFGGMSFVIGIAVAFALTEHVHGHTINTVGQLARQYTSDTGLLRYVSSIWMGLCALLIFHGSRFVLSLGFGLFMKWLIDFLSRDDK